MTQTILITGCSSGFGHATARHFANAGWNVVATMRNPAAADDLAGQDNILVTALDVQDTTSIDAAIAAGIERFGAIDALVNNAGFGLHGMFEETPRAKVKEQFEVNVFGMMDTIRSILPHFRARKKGLIVNISSGAGVFALPASTLYNASKFALEGFSEALAYELAPLGITVKIVEPGGVLDTGFLGRAYTERDATVAIDDYAPIVAKVADIFANLSAERQHTTSAQVAEAIFGAVTDGVDTLRYIATPDIVELVKLRREAGEETYMNAMRTHFAITL
ncbi:SDR family oxidoreductase [Qipengyuania sp. GH25]|uniref:SDR family oxidoreductase n=1 Tax=Qipengyuania pacifica TaxID=2860199 RepID=A0ABS7JK65_9SPHN|nr:SDR family oxidoreductase [Qipengyuania aerophila]MBX7489780.1 SDR family oxidoreductase [Qipengyuania aerophila]